MSLDETLYDLIVVGGGINGVGIARDAAGRGLSVLLLEKNDLAQATSSASTKLIHGGLRYLEHYEFRLVREALKEREVLLNAAPQIIWPMTFLLPRVAGLRPAWMIRAGLFLYDNLAKRERLPGSGGVDFTRHPAGAVLKPEIRRGFHYADCWVDDARLVVVNALDAEARGARILTRSPFLGARREGDRWAVRARIAGREVTLRARALVNAAGPWVDRVLEASREVSASGERRPRRQRVRLVKGSHIVVARSLPGPEAFIFQNADGRIAFAIPYEERFTLIGTTDVPVTGDPADSHIEAGEVDYLLGLVNRYFAKPLRREEVAWSYSGVRPLYDDGQANASAVTRDYVFDLDPPAGNESAPLLSVFGGKITTYRKLAEHALDKLLPRLSAGEGPGGFAGAWTAGARLPGGVLGDRLAGPRDYARTLQARHPWLPEALARRFARSYGSLAEEFLVGAHDLADLGRAVAPGLHEAELDYLMRREWAGGADDVLWRRSKLGLHLNAEEREAVTAWFEGGLGRRNPSRALES